MLSEGEHLHENGHVISLTVLGFTYADIMKWSTEHSHSLSPGKISLFLNQKLDVAKSREMMDILSGYLDSAKDLGTEQDVPELPENLAFEIDKVGDKLKNSGS